MDKKKIILWIVAGVVLVALIVAACFLFVGNNDAGSGKTEPTEQNNGDAKENISMENSIPDAEEDVVFRVGKQTMSRDFFNLYVNLAGYNCVSTFYSTGYLTDIENFSWDDKYEDGQGVTTYNGLAREMALEALLPVYAILDKGIEFGIVWEDADEKELRDWIAEKKKGFGENFDEYLQKGGYGTEEIYYQYFRLQRHRDKIYADIEKNMSKYVDLNKLTDYTKDTITANHILVMFEGVDSGDISDEDRANTRKKAEDILARLKNGEDFETLRKEFSEDPGAGDEGYTFYQSGELNDGSGGVLYPQFAQTAFALKIGEFSDLVETDYGFHIIRRMERKTKITDYIEYLRDNTQVQVNKPLYEQINVKLDIKDYYLNEEATPAE